MDQGGLTILTVGDVTVDEYLSISKGDAELLCDIHHDKCRISFDYGEKIPVENYHFGFGGSALNTSIGFARLGFKAKIAGFCGEDTRSQELTDFLKKGGVDTQALKKEGEMNRSSIIIFAGERTVFSYHAKRDYRTLELPKCDWLYLASASEGSNELCTAILSAVKTGAKLVINPGSWELKHFDKFKTIAQESIAIILNMSEAEIITGKKSIRQQVDGIHKLGAKIAVITDGKNGSYASAANRILHLGIFASEAVDSTGAGDSFSCGFIAGLIYKKSLEQAMIWGMANSTSVVEKIGANTGLLKYDEIERVVRSVRDIQPQQI